MHNELIRRLCIWNNEKIPQVRDTKSTMISTYYVGFRTMTVLWYRLLHRNGSILHVKQSNITKAQRSKYAAIKSGM